MEYYIAVNAYRRSTSSGFFKYYQLNSRKEQNRLLKEGLPIKDAHLIDDKGYYHLVYSNLGIRLLSKQEYKAIKRDKKLVDVLA